MLGRGSRILNKEANCMEQMYCPHCINWASLRTCVKRGLTCQQLLVSSCNSCFVLLRPLSLQSSWWASISKALATDFASGCHQEASCLIFLRCPPLKITLATGQPASSRPAASDAPSVQAPASQLPALLQVLFPTNQHVATF